MNAWKERGLGAQKVAAAKIEAEKAKHELQAKLAEKGLFVREPG